jgi:hypothetical protein
MFSMQVKVKHIFSNIFFITDSYMYLSLCLNFFHLLAWKPTLEKFATYSNKFFHNFHLSQTSGKWVSVKTGISDVIIMK